MNNSIDCPPIVTEFVERLQLCRLCRYRLLQGSLFHSFGFPRAFRESAMEAGGDNTTCSLCFGLCGLFVSNDAEIDILSEIAKKVKESGFDFSTFQLNVSEPVNLALRDHAFWVYIREKCKDSNITELINTLEEEAVSAKVVFRNLINEHLTKLFQETISQPSLFSNLKPPPSWYDPATEQIDLLVSFDLPIETYGTDDCARLVSALKRHSHPSRYNVHFSSGSEARRRAAKQRRRLAEGESTEAPDQTLVSRTALKKLLSLLTNKAFLEDVINLETEKTEGRKLPLIQLASVKVSRSAPLIVAGRYAKLSRTLPQTPWFIDGERKFDSSVEELISAQVTPIFGPNTTFTFVSSGREDIDVRCVGLGRPFALELSHYSRTLSSMLRIHSDQCGDRIDVKEVVPDRANHLSWLAVIVNKSTDGRVFVRDLQVVSAASSKASLKDGDVEKRKCYRALCWCPQGGLTTEKIRLLDSRLRALSHQALDSDEALQWPPIKATFQPDLGCELAYLNFGRFTIEQRTPVRVLHRRPLIARKRDIIWFRLADFASNVLKDDAPFVLREYASQAKVYPKEELFLLELCCEAGTYVKELVHGDLGRTQPSLSSLLDSTLDLIALDVIAVEQDWPPRIEHAPVGVEI